MVQGKHVKAPSDIRVEESVDHALKPRGGARIKLPVDHRVTVPDDRRVESSPAGRVETLVASYVEAPAQSPVQSPVSTRVPPPIERVQVPVDREVQAERIADAKRAAEAKRKPETKEAQAKERRAEREPKRESRRKRAARAKESATEAGAETAAATPGRARHFDNRLKTPAEKGTKPPADNYVFVAPDAGRWFMRAGMVASLVVLCVGATLTVTEKSFPAVVGTGVAAVLLIVLWAMLQSKIPQRITVRGSMIQIRRDGRVDAFDLEDPAVDIRVSDGEIAFAHYQDRWVVVRARDVDWKVFSDVVMHYQNKADLYAEERDKRFNR